MHPSAVWLIGIATLCDDLIAASVESEAEARAFVEAGGTSKAYWLGLAQKLAAAQFGGDTSDVSDILFVWIGQPGLCRRINLLGPESFQD